MKTAEYLEMALTKRARGVNAELARMLGIARSAITHYQTGHRIMDDYTASKVAEVLGIDEEAMIQNLFWLREKLLGVERPFTTITNTPLLFEKGEHEEDQNQQDDTNEQQIHDTDLR